MTGSCSPRGYYLYAVPLEIEPCYGSNAFKSVLGTGIKDCLLEVKRQTDKQLEIACSIAVERAPLLLEWCREHYGIQFEMPAEFFLDAAKRPIPSALPKPSLAKHVETNPIRGMKLLTAGIIRKLEKHPFSSQESKGDDATVLVKFFGGAAYTFLVTEGERQSTPALTEHRGNAMLSSPTAMGITGFNAFPSVIHFSISPATCQRQAADAVAAFAVPHWL